MSLLETISVHTVTGWQKIVHTVTDFEQNQSTLLQICRIITDDEQWLYKSTLLHFNQNSPQVKPNQSTQVCRIITDIEQWP